MVRQVDVTDREQMVRLVSELRERCGDVHGIVHAAGVVAGPSFALLPDLTRAECEQQFQAKVQGLRLLTELFADIPLDFALAASSVATTCASSTPTASQLLRIAEKLCDLCTRSMRTVRSGCLRASAVRSRWKRSGVMVGGTECVGRPGHTQDRTPRSCRGGVSRH